MSPTRFSLHGQIHADDAIDLGFESSAIYFELLDALEFRFEGQKRSVPIIGLKFPRIVRISAFSDRDGRRKYDVLEMNMKVNRNAVWHVHKAHLDKACDVRNSTGAGRNKFVADLGCFNSLLTMRESVWAQSPVLSWTGGMDVFLPLVNDLARRVSREELSFDAAFAAIDLGRTPSPLCEDIEKMR